MTTEKNPDIAELAAAVTKAEAENVALQKSLTDSTAANAELKARLEALEGDVKKTGDAVLVELRKSVETAVAENVALRKRLDDADAAADLARYTAEAAKFSHVPQPQAEIAKALQLGDKLGAEAGAMIRKTFEHAEAMGVGILHATPRSMTLTPGTPEGELDALVQKCIATDNVTEAEAYTRVLKTEAGQALYARSVGESRRAN